jgi:hypothetical protein
MKAVEDLERVEGVRKGIDEVYIGHPVVSKMGLCRIRMMIRRRVTG